LAVVLALLVGCGDSSKSPASDVPPGSDTIGSPAEQALILGVSETESWTFSELHDTVHVLRTESDIPHVYASNVHDLAYVLGFVTARHRYFMMDLARRMAQGRISELLGDLGLETDLESRGMGMAHVTQRMADHMTQDMVEYSDAFAAGVNEYVAQVSQGKLPPPSELNLAKLVLGVSDPVELMKPFERKDVAAILAVLLYEFSNSSAEFGRTAAYDQLDGLFEGQIHQDLRRAGVKNDIWNQIAPVLPASSAAGWGMETGDSAQKPGASTNPGKGRASMGTPVHKKIPALMLERLVQKYKARDRLLRRSPDSGFGSNAWAVNGAHTTDGAGLLAGDGHMGLEVPSLMYVLGLDTRVFGGGDIHIKGLTVPGIPTAGIGTNGHVAWSMTNLFGDVTDYYREELTLDEQGLPSQSFFEGEWKPLSAIEETYKVAALLGEPARTDVLTRWTSFDGRWLISIEGRSAGPEEELANGESLINVSGDWVVPQDMNEDGTISAVSMDYSLFDASAFMHHLHGLSQAQTVWDIRESMRAMVGMGANWSAADDQGSIYYSAYQATPCRDYLARDENGDWLPGADPTMILDGTTYGGFSIPTTPDGRVDEEPGKTDPYQCVIPFDQMPMSMNPSRGYVMTANNDPGNIATDNSLSNDPWFMGGPWDAGYRANTISTHLEEAIATDTADAGKMAAIQANHDSRLGELFSPMLLETIQFARDLMAQDSGLLSPEQARLVALYAADAVAFDAVETRLKDWASDGFQAESGVFTFYEEPTAQEQKDAVATMIFNVWLGRTLRMTFDDEGIPGGVWETNGDHGRLRAFKRIWAGRGAENPEQLASWNPETQESIFFDKVGTDPVERSGEVVLMALADGLAFLRSEPTGPGEGGFGTDDMAQWLWGLRHQARFESLLLGYLSADSEFAMFAEPFSISTKVLPLGDRFEQEHPSDVGMKWFPRHGDQFNVDAGNPGLNGEKFTYGSGPMMRMVVALKDGQVTGHNVIPGGQSGLTSSPFFADQAALWLGNKAHPLRFHVNEVVEGAVGREIYRPH
jgi:penicillin amidase